MAWNPPTPHQPASKGVWGEQLNETLQYLRDSQQKIITAPVGSTPTVPEGALLINYDYELIKYALDTFNRTAAAGVGLGSADVGGPWTQGDGTSSLYTIDPTNHLKLTMTSGQKVSAWLASLVTTILDAELTVDVSFGVPSGGNTAAHFALRRDANGNLGYSLYFYRTSNGSLTVHIAHNTGTLIQSYTGVIPGFTTAMTATPVLHGRLRVSGSNPTRLQMKVWGDSVAEPSAWLVDVTDSTATTLQDAGGFAWSIGQNAATTAATVTQVHKLQVTELPPA